MNPPPPGRTATRARPRWNRRSSSSSPSRAIPICPSTPRRNSSPTCAVKLEALNHYNFTDSEWDRFFHEALANPNEHIVEKTRKVQEDFVQVLRPGRRHFQKHHPAGQEKHPQQPAAGPSTSTHRQPGPGRPPRQPLRRDHPGQRPAPGPCGTQAPGRGHPGSLQPDRPLPAGLLLVGLRPV